MTEQEVIEKLAHELFKIQHPSLDWGHTGTIDDDSWRRFENKCRLDAKRLFNVFVKQAGYVRLAEDQSLPGNPYPLDYPDGGDCYYATEQAQKAMLKEGWKKVEL